MSEQRQIAFAERPQGKPDSSIFVERKAKIEEPGENEILCRNIILSIDPYLRLKMHDRESYTPPLQPGETIPGRSIARVEKSATKGFDEGDLVVIFGGWQEYATLPSSSARRLPGSAENPADYLGPLGITGETAYFGLLCIGNPARGETVVVSAAAGAVGGLVGQIASAKGCRVVGIAGTDEKCRYVVDELGFDACVNYKAADFEETLTKACPTGVDVYFDNVGGRVTRAVIPLLNDFARVPVCGQISQYHGANATEATVFDEMMRLILVKRLKIQGFIVSDFAGRSDEFEREMTSMIRTGKIKQRYQEYAGFDEIVQAFFGMLEGENIGKTIVRLDT